MMEVFNGILAVYAESRSAWRTWLDQNHQTEKSVWLIIYRKQSNIPTVYYPEAVDEALCFGWIDSTPKKRDENSYYQFFAIRNPKSGWSRVNKEKIAKLLEAGLMHPSGLEAISVAQKNGAWSALDEVENLVLPPDLLASMEANPLASENWSKFSRSSKRGILEWISQAKKEETRKKRIEETVRLATENVKANHPRK